MKNFTAGQFLEACGGTFYGPSGILEQNIQGVKVDSRQIRKGDLFIATVGERTDGHRFIPGVFEKGALCAVSQQKLTDPAGPYILVKDTLQALKDGAEAYRKTLSIPVIGVTGSVGKTSTKEMIASVAAQKYKVHKTLGNFNNEWGLPITIFEMKEEHQVAVLEMGVNHFGEMRRLSAVATPDICVITNIGVAHLEFFKTREGILQEKSSMIQDMKNGGTIILNGDDDLLKETVGKPGVRTVYYGLGENCQYRAEEIRNWDGGVEFTAVAGEKRQLVRLSVMGEHNVRNALAAIAVCDAMGMSLSEAAKGLSSFHGFEHRQQVFKGSRFTVLDDSYNASPASMKAALKVLMELPGKRHIAVLADMKELGEGSPEYHREVGEYAGSLGLSLAAVWGTDMKEFAKGLRETGDTPVAEFAGKDELAAFLEREVQEGDCLLFKGSNSMGVSVLAERFKKLAGLSEG